MTKRQRIYLMAELWPAAAQAQGWPVSDRGRRLAVLSRAVGRPLDSASDLDEKRDFDRVKSYLGFLAENVAGTVETEHPEIGDRRRYIWKHSHIQLPCLALYVDAAAYVREILRDRFKIFNGLNSIEDLDTPTLLQLVMTLDRCINDLRRQAGDSVHVMNQKAGLPCRQACHRCRHLAPAHEHSLVHPVSENEPF